MGKTLTSNPQKRFDTVKSLKPCNLSNCTKEQIVSYLNNTFDLYETLFSCVKDDKYFYLSPDRLRRPLIFYFVHTASFYINKLMLSGLINKRVNLEFESMCEIGVDEMSWDDLDTEGFDWPSMPKAVEYRNQVRQILLEAIEKTPLVTPVTEENPWWALFMGFEHDRIHLETSAVLLHQLPVEMVEKPEGWTYAPIQADGEAKNEFVTVPEGKVTIGKPRDAPSFGWDNEYGSWTTTVPQFESTKFLITNREFLKFVVEGGYQKSQYWTNEGWSWREYRQSTHPTFWVCNKKCKSGNGQGLLEHTHCNINEEGYKYRAMFDIIDLPLDWPVDVNYHEAKAYCNWLGEGYRLPTEAEHYRMRNNYDANDVNQDIIFKEGSDIGNLNMRFGSSSPVNMFPPTEKGFYDVMGNVWEWGEDNFNGLPGFKTCRYYDDFSTPCFDGRHNMILGGSWIATGDEASYFARFAFRRHFFQHLGFRVVRNQPNTPAPARFVNNEIFILCAGTVQENPIVLPNIDKDLVGESTNCQYATETTDWLTKKLLMHYAPEKLPISEEARNYPVNIARLFLESAKEYGAKCKSVLEIGCGVGRTSFEIASVAKKVVAVDFTARFIHVAQQIQSNRLYEFNATLGEKSEKIVAVAPRGSGGCVDFRQLTCLPNNIGKYDCILVHNICQFSNPTAWLLRMRELVNPGGLIVVTYGFWNKKFCTAPLCYDANDNRVDELDVLKELFDKYLTLVQTTSLKSCEQLTTDLTSTIEETLSVAIFKSDS